MEFSEITIEDRGKRFTLEHAEDGRIFECILFKLRSIGGLSFRSAPGHIGTPAPGHTGTLKHIYLSASNPNKSKWKIIKHES